MVVMKFIIELEIGLLFPLKSALPKLKTDRNAKTHRRGRRQAAVRPCRRRTEIPERNPSRRRTARAARSPVSKAMYVRPAL